MAQFRVRIDDSENIATQEQADEYFSDLNESANTVSTLPPVYSRTDWVVDLAFVVYRDPPDPETGEETDFKDYTITEMFVNTVALYANGEPIPTNVDETEYFNINVFSTTGTQEIIIPGTPDIIEYVTVGPGESIGKVSLQEYESPFNDDWSYLSDEKTEVTVDTVEELPSSKTYKGIYKWRPPTPDYLLIQREFVILAEDNEGGTYSFDTTLRQGYYFSYTPYLTAIPETSDKGEW